METDGCDFQGCSLTTKQRRDFIHSYAQLLLEYRDIQNRPLSDVDIFAQIMNYTADFNTSTKEWANDLTSVVNKTTGAFTLITALGKRQTVVFGDSGFNSVYSDQQNQIYHWWAYVNTTTQGGKGGLILGAIGNEVHEFYDPTGISHKQGNTGNSWEDYALAENGLAFGLLLHNGTITPETASDSMRAALATDSRRPVVQWAMDHIPNSWLPPNIVQYLYYGLRTDIGQP